MINYYEPSEAFPYRAPDEKIKSEYPDIFVLNQPLKIRFFKLCFDKIVAFVFLVLCLPLFGLLYLANVIEGLIIPANRGPLFFYYNAVSAGKVFKKYKIRIIKKEFIDKKLQAEGDWHAFSNEWNPKARTYLGKFVKRFYLDEIPQLFSVLMGDMSIVGPRSLAVHHYKRDLLQGNISRLLIRGGLLGPGHIHKGTSEMGNPSYEYRYIRSYINSSSFSLLMLDLKIIGKGIRLIFKGKGL